MFASIIFWSTPIYRLLKFVEWEISKLQGFVGLGAAVRLVNRGECPSSSSSFGTNSGRSQNQFSEQRSHLPNPIRDDIIIIVNIAVIIAIVITINIPKTDAIALQRLWP